MDGQWEKVLHSPWQVFKVPYQNSKSQLNHPVRGSRVRPPAPHWFCLISSPPCGSHRIFGPGPTLSLWSAPPPTGLQLSKCSIIQRLSCCWRSWAKYCQCLLDSICRLAWSKGFFAPVCIDRPLSLDVQFRRRFCRDSCGVTSHAVDDPCLLSPIATHRRTCFIRRRTASSLLASSGLCVAGLQVAFVMCAFSIGFAFVRIGSIFLVFNIGVRSVVRYWSVSSARSGNQFPCQLQKFWRMSNMTSMASGVQVPWPDQQFVTSNARNVRLLLVLEIRKERRHHLWPRHLLWASTSCAEHCAKSALA